MKPGESEETSAMPSPKCAKCGAEMEEGFIPDEAHGPRHYAIWVAGKPERDRLMGPKIDGKRAHSIHAFRCTKCGYVEQYALGSP